MSFAYASNMNTALTATTQNAILNTAPTARRRLFSSFSTHTIDIDSEDLLHPALYPVPAISRLSRDRTRTTTASKLKPNPSLALASAIARKLPVIPSSLTLAQRVSEDTQDMEDANELFALIASTKETLMMAPTPVAAAFPKTRVPDFSFKNSFNDTWSSCPVDGASPSFSSEDADDYFDFDFQFDDSYPNFDEDEDDSASVSSVSSVDSCFDFLASTKPQSLFRVTSSSSQRPASPPIPATVFVPPQVRSNMNMMTCSPFSFSNLPQVQVNTNTRARAESIVSTSSVSSSSSCGGSWRSSSSRASISSASSVSSYSASASSSPIQKAKPIPSASTFSSPAPKATTAPAPKSAAPTTVAATKTKYLYQGGVSTVLGGGVMLGGGSSSSAGAKPRAQIQPQPQAQRQRSTYTNNAANANSSSWRRRY